MNRYKPANLDKYKVFDEARRAAWYSVWVLVGIGIAEILVSTFTGSLTLFADGLDSIADGLVSGIVWFGIRMIHKPKTDSFHFGYAKIESLAAFIAAIAIIILGFFIVYNAYERIIHPSETTNPEITMITLLAAGSISLYRAFQVRRIAKKYNLVSLTLDAKNSIKDGSASFVGFASVLAGYFGIPYMDTVGGIIIAGYIFFMAYTAIKESALVLIDALKNPNLHEDIKDHILKNLNVDVVDVLIRPLGHGFYAQIHVALDHKMTLDNVYEILEKIKSLVKEEFEIEETVIVPTPKNPS
jgi:cation diffusion facilitator family transporter